MPITMELRARQKPLKERYREEPATAMELPVDDVQVTVEGDLDLSGTLGVAREVPVGFETIRLDCKIVAPAASDEQIAALQERTERYCVVLQTLTESPRIETTFSRAQKEGS
jgi:uncharacterized OsmC-like protein